CRCHADRDRPAQVFVRHGPAELTSPEVHTRNEVTVRPVALCALRSVEPRARDDVLGGAGMVLCLRPCARTGEKPSDQHEERRHLWSTHMLMCPFGSAADL